MAIGCGVIILALFVAGWLGIRWVQENLGLTSDPVELRAWSEEIIGMAPPEEFVPEYGMFADENQAEAILTFSRSLSRGSEVSLAMLLRTGQHTFTSIFQGVSLSGEGAYTKFQSEVGEAEQYFANWGDLRVPVQLAEGYDKNEQLSRQITGLIAFPEHTVALFFKGPPEELDREIIQQMLDRIPAEWQPQPLPAATPRNE